MAIGVTAAYIFALLPPVSSGKVAIRHSYAKTISQVGVILCDVISQAGDPLFDEGTNQAQTRENVLAIKRKLVKLAARHVNLKYELSFKGRWPLAKYKALHSVLQDLSALLAQLHHVMREMPVDWRKAVLERTSLSKSRFLGDVMAVIGESERPATP